MRESLWGVVAITGCAGGSLGRRCSGLTYRAHPSQKANGVVGGVAYLDFRSSWQRSNIVGDLTTQATP